MKSRRFGRTEFKISQLTLGGGWVGGILIDPDKEIMHKALSQASEKGINWIDTAESYSEGKSEKNIGDLLPLFSNDTFKISTKARLDPNSSESIVSQIDRKIDASLGRLQRNFVELYQLHNRIQNISDKNNFSVKDILKKGGVADAMEKFKSDGRIKSIGITALGDIDAINEVVLSDCFDVAQIYYNLLNPSASFSSPGKWDDHNFSNLIKNCESKDMGLMNIRIYAAGYLATDQRHGREIPITFGIDETELNKRVEKINFILKDIQGTNAQKALRYGLSNDNMSTIVIGLAKISHLEEALEGYEIGSLDEEILKKIEELQNNNFIN
ncbi:MAG: aldo/keto reductase [Alphaproteobacteria bacterium]|nr:MAG: aldo/keto reductase [Alphaproteobacteria bacterium]|tara:strand:+ start:380 stop:1360 length:981 start_codon:yes stop_codon:yes gene_type:complete